MSRYPAEVSLRELHGICQVCMGWKGIRLFQFHFLTANDHRTARDRAFQIWRDVAGGARAA